MASSARASPATVRVRIIEDKKAWITLKSPAKGIASNEFEYLIPNSDGEKIMSNLTNTIKKNRFFLDVGKKQWIIDCFKEKNFPLEVAEIELSKEEEEFKLPTFVSK